MTIINTKRRLSKLSDWFHDQGVYLVLVKEKYNDRGYVWVKEMSWIIDNLLNDSFEDHQICFDTHNKKTNLNLTWARINSFSSYGGEHILLIKAQPSAKPSKHISLSWLNKVIISFFITEKGTWLITDIFNIVYDVFKS